MRGPLQAGSASGLRTYPLPKSTRGPRNLLRIKRVRIEMDCIRELQQGTLPSPSMSNTYPWRSLRDSVRTGHSLRYADLALQHWVVTTFLDARIHRNQLDHLVQGRKHFLLALGKDGGPRKSQPSPALGRVPRCDGWISRRSISLCPSGLVDLDLGQAHLQSDTRC